MSEDEKFLSEDEERLWLIFDTCGSKDFLLQQDFIIQQCRNYAQHIRRLEAALAVAEKALTRLVKGFDQNIATVPTSYAAEDCYKALAQIQKLREGETTSLPEG